jgi:predicted short-subunit dehydrogenase-like oxidoreductase (DUF2520 family)
MYSSGFKIDLIVSESDKSGALLAYSCNASSSTELDFPDTTDIIIVAVPDNRLTSVLEKIKCKPDTLVAHTAGSLGMDIFPGQLTKRGIFYPLQTFSKGRKVDFKDLPVLLESSDKHSSEILEYLAQTIGCKVYMVDTEQRRQLHLAAVIVCNFTNHLLTMGKDVIRNTGYSFEILGPLVQETIAKAIDIGPENSQTGPAVRNDLNTIEKHLELLSWSPELQRLYNEMTRSIIKYYNKS